MYVLNLGLHAFTTRINTAFIRQMPKKNAVTVLHSKPQHNVFAA